MTHQGKEEWREEDGRLQAAESQSGIIPGDSAKHLESKLRPLGRRTRRQFQLI